MELVINISPWPENNPLEHIDSIITVKDKDGIEVFPEESLGGKKVWAKEVNIPVGETYEVIEKKVFRLKNNPDGNDDLTYESTVHTFTNNDAEISNMLLAKPIIVEKPELLIKLSDIENNNSDSIVINTSKFRGSGDGHSHTHWVIVVDGKIEFRSLLDTVNKTSITIPKHVLLNYNQEVIIYVTHCSNFIESPTAIYKLNKDYMNFEVTSNLINVPMGDYKLKIEKLDTEKRMLLTKVIVSIDEMIIKTYEITGDNNTVNLTIPALFIEPNGILVIELYGYNEKAELGKKTYKLIPHNLQYEDNINKDYEYSKTFSSKIYERTLPIGLVSDSLNKGILIPNDTNFNVYKYTETGFVNSGTISTLLHLGKKDNLLVKVTNDRKIIIDTYNNVDKPTFLVYSYDSISNTYLLDFIKTREDEEFTLAYNNSIEQINSDEFIYSVRGTNKLRKYNKLTNELVDLKDITIIGGDDNGPLPDITESTIIKMDDNNLLIITDASFKTTIYNIEFDKYIEGMLIPFAGYHNQCIKKVDLINGDKMLLINKASDNIDKVLYFDISEFKLLELEYVINKTNNNITLRYDNDILICSIIEKDFINHMVDRLEVTAFK